MRKHRFIGFVLTAATVVGPLIWLTTTTPARAAVVISDGGVSWRLPLINTPLSVHRALPSPGAVAGSTTPVTALFSELGPAVPLFVEGGQGEQVRIIERQASVRLNEEVSSAYAAALAQLALQEAAEHQSPPRANTTPVAAPTPSPPPATGDVWAELRDCESGGNYAEDTGNGFYGAYQFAPSTWSALGYAGLPNEAPPAVQDAAAQELQSRSGWGQWPGCSAKLGL
jgi:hypothetical protein